MTAILVHTVCHYHSDAADGEAVWEYDKPAVLTGSFTLEPLREGFVADDAVRAWAEKHGKKLPGCSVEHSANPAHVITYLEESFEEVCAMLGLQPSDKAVLIRRNRELEAALAEVTKSRDAHCRVRDRCIDRLGEFMAPATLHEFLENIVKES